MRLNILISLFCGLQVYVLLQFFEFSETDSFLTAYKNSLPN